MPKRFANGMSINSSRINRAIGPPQLFVWEKNTTLSNTTIATIKKIDLLSVILVLCRRVLETIRFVHLTTLNRPVNHF